TEQPDVLAPETYILGSSIVGIVEQSQVIDGSKIEVGDAVIAIASSGPHTNGYTLIRDLLRKNPDLREQPVGDTTFLESVLAVHRCYYQSLRRVFPQMTGLAHITGGGIRENLDRILPSHVDAQIDLGLYNPPPVFEAIRAAGNVSPETMLRTFNLGVGVAIVC